MKPDKPCPTCRCEMHQKKGPCAGTYLLAALTALMIYYQRQGAVDSKLFQDAEDAIALALEEGW